MQHHRKTKILATLGPNSSDENTIRRLHEAGANVFRINMSHASHDTMRQLMGYIRSVEAQCSTPIGILVDLQGPKLRVGKFADTRIRLQAGRTFTLDHNKAPGDETRVELPHPEIFSAIRPGHRLLIDDGRLCLRAEECDEGRILCKVISGTEISDRKGVSLPDTLLGAGALTEKDRQDLDAALDAGEADWLALSFVERPEDLLEMRRIVKGRAGIMAKIEKPQAIERIDEIIELCDAIMVARGDLGVEMPVEAVPGIQKQLTRLCRQAGKPIVVATQMLESMISSAMPTRAEVSDVSSAVFEGADAVMLSAESASGSYPVEAVAMMAAIAKRVEMDPLYGSILGALRTPPEATSADAISLAARQIADTLGLSAIVTYSSTGATSLRAARERPNAPILSLSPTVGTARRLSICWGMQCVVTPDAEDLDGMVERGLQIAASRGLARPGEGVIVSAGLPLGLPGGTNMLRIAYVDRQ